MRKFKKLYYALALAGLVVTTSCEVSELELLTSPNNVTSDSADPSFVLNDIQLSFNGIFGGYSGPAAAITRQVNQFSTYNNVVSAPTLNGEWGSSYQLFANIDVLEDIDASLIGDGRDGVPYHLGVGYILEAYSYFLLVDFIGDVPYSEAVMPEEFPNPNTDPGTLVYQAQLELLDNAIAKLNEGIQVNAPQPEDLYYTDSGFDAANWIALANTLKIRAYLNLGLTDPAGAAQGINSVLGSNIIDTIDEDFDFDYGTSDLPESRHPFFTGNYLAGGAGTRMSNYFLDLLNAGDAQPPFVETGIIDPRTRYYIYRQSSSAPSGSNLPCEGEGNYDYCYVGNLYWGRDHADNEGLPNDNFLRSIYGLYPGGGAFDKDQLVQARTLTETLGGEGITPMFLSSFTHFALAEAALTLNTNGNALSLLQQGIRLSMEKVSNFGGSAVDPEGFGMTQADIDAYVNRVTNEYNGASPSGKLAIIAREYYLASWGNGVEPYNTLRRTGYPDVQSPIFPAGSFPRSFQYPQTETDGNPNISPKPLTTAS